MHQKRHQSNPPGKPPGKRAKKHLIWTATAQNEDAHKQSTKLHKELCGAWLSLLAAPSRASSSENRDSPSPPCRTGCAGCTGCAACAGCAGGAADEEACAVPSLSMPIPYHFMVGNCTVCWEHGTKKKNDVHTISLPYMQSTPTPRRHQRNV